jgi:hypothetical protein
VIGSRVGIAAGFIAAKYFSGAEAQHHGDLAG